MSWVEELWVMGNWFIWVVMFLLIRSQSARWCKNIVLGKFVGGVLGRENVAKTVLWSDPRSSSTQHSSKCLVKLGDEKMRSFTSSLPVLSLV